MDNRIYIPLNTEYNKDAPAVLLSMRAHRKITLWTTIAATMFNWEVSGIGTAQKQRKGIYVSDVWLIEPEKVGGAHVDQDPKAIHRLMEKIWMGTGELKESTRPDSISFVGGRDLRNLRFLWHSHANFGVGWSGTDDVNARYDFCPDATWTLNLVTNSRGHMLARMDFPKKNNELAAEARRLGRGEIPDTVIDKLPVRLVLPMKKSQVNELTRDYMKAHEKVVPNIQAPKPLLGPTVKLPQSLRGEFLKEDNVVVITPPKRYPHLSDDGKMPDPTDAGDLFKEFGVDDVTPEEFQDLVAEQENTVDAVEEWWNSENTDVVTVMENIPQVKEEFIDRENPPFWSDIPEDLQELIRKYYRATVEPQPLDEMESLEETEELRG